MSSWRMPPVHRSGAAPALDVRALGLSNAATASLNLVLYPTGSPDEERLVIDILQLANQYGR